MHLDPPREVTLFHKSKCARCLCDVSAPELRQIGTRNSSIDIYFRDHYRCGAVKMP